ncbi:MAG: DNA polymerase I [Gammaproteobacteria bacterium]|nr:DNA polymerase I [Gammaproteobacteria bacterium]
MAEQRTLLLIDGSSYLYRAFHAMPALTNSKGDPTGAVYGITAMLKRIHESLSPDLVAVVFDAHGKTFRDDLYAEYKANRPPMPDELRSQEQAIREVIKAMGLRRIEVSGVEADDVIGTLARLAAERGMTVLMSTNDKDMAQLVDDDVLLVNNMDDSRLDSDAVEARFGVPPSLIVDYLTLIGDTVDNVPGVPKVGPKTAVKWLEEYGSLDGIIDNAASIKGKVGENLRAALEQLPLSRELVTIRRDVDLDFDLDDLRPGEADRERLRELFTELEFKTWLAELLNDPELKSAGNGGSGNEPRRSYETVLDQSRFDSWLERLKDADLFAFDTETTSLDYMAAEIVGVSFAIVPGEAAYVPLAHSYPEVPEQLDREQVLEQLRPLLEDPERAKLGQNLKYDMSVLARHGVELRGVRYDTMLESYVLDSTATRHDMDSLALKYLGERTIAFEEVAGKGKSQLTFDQVPLEQAGEYAAEDADVTLRLHHELWSRLAPQKALRTLFEELEMPLIGVLSRIERTGVRIDASLLEAQSRELATRMKEIEAEAYEAAGEPFKLGSTKQIQELLFDKHKLPVLAKTPKGQPSTAESVLQELAHEHPLPRLILEHRALSKLRSTYTEALPSCINPSTGRVHTSYHQAVASTGRLSSSEPNLQNIPVRTEEGRRIRRAFIPADGYRLLAADYSQIELRIMAHLSEDQGLRAAFERGEDVHRATAAEVFDVEPDAVDAEQRRRAKAINFGLIYGMSAFGLGRQLGIERGEAQSYVDLYFERYPGVKAYMDRTREKARADGFVETVFGRRLYLPEINSRNAQRRQYAERTAINAPMQGTAADIIKRAMLRVDEAFAGKADQVRMIMQVHDELVFEVRENQVDAVRDDIEQIMVGAASLEVPLVVELGVGDNWESAH